MWGEAATGLLPVELEAHRTLLSDMMSKVRFAC
jgi:hypothetical protein